LEIFVWLGIGSLLVFPFEAKLPLVAVRRFTAWAAALAAVLLGTYLGLLAVQDRDLRAEIDHLLAGPRTEIITSLSELPGDRLLLKVPTPPEHAAILEQPPDSLSLPAILTVMPSRVISATDRLMIEIGGPECRGSSVELKLSYAKRPGIWQPLDRTITIPVANEGERTLFITPAVYRATQNFEGFNLPAPQVGCVSSVSRLAGPSNLPAIFTAILAPNWQEQKLHLGLGAP
jgi:hypothetical protein